jgi:hypothetical protein
MNKISEHFVIQEFVPPQIYNQFKDNSIWFINPQVVKMAEFVRKFFNKPVTINNWHIGGTYTESGFRLPNTETGAKLSAHKRGCAIDIKMPGVDYDQVRETILKNQKEFMEAGITTIEDGTQTWLHVDCRYTMLDKILVVPFQ